MYRRRPACEFSGRLAPSRYGRRTAARTRRRGRPRYLESGPPTSDAPQRCVGPMLRRGGARALLTSPATSFPTPRPVRNRRSSLVPKNRPNSPPVFICLNTHPPSCHTRRLALESFLSEPHVNYSSATPTQWKRPHRPASFPPSTGASSPAPMPPATPRAPPAW